MLPDSTQRAVLACAKALPASMSAHERVRTVAALVAWKRLDDQFEEQVCKRREWGFPHPANLRWHSYVVPPHARFEIAEDAAAAFRQIGAWNPCLRDHVDVITPKLSGRALHAARLHLAPLDFRDEALDSPDVVGLAYELVRMEYLRPTNDHGEFFSPPNICEMMVLMNDPKSGKSVLDPAAGSGRMLQHAAWYVRRNDPMAGLSFDPPPLLLVAQDIQPFLAALCQFSLLALGYANAVCIARDALRYPVTMAEASAIVQERAVAIATLRILTAMPDPDRPEYEVAPRTFFQVERPTMPSSGPATVHHAPQPTRSSSTQTSLFDA